MAQDSNRWGGGGLEYGNKHSGCVIYVEFLNRQIICFSVRVLHH